MHAYVVRVKIPADPFYVPLQTSKRRLPTRCASAIYLSRLTSNCLLTFSSAGQAQGRRRGGGREEGKGQRVRVNLFSPRPPLSLKFHSTIL